MEEIPIFPEVFFKKVGYYLGIRLGTEPVPLTSELLLKFLIIFDNSVMGQGYFPVAVGVGVGIGITGLAMGSPPGVPNSNP